MEQYLGEFDVDILTTEFANYTSSDWAIFIIEQYGSGDGAHHKTWVIDQVTRILFGTPIIIKEARWGASLSDSSLHSEYRISLGEPSEKYLAWCKEMQDIGYDYDYGIAP